MIEAEHVLGEVTDEIEQTPDEGPPVPDLQTALAEQHDANARGQEGKHS